ncbi:hypothetical protein [Salinigranum salinum]|uniref:hypothetical protein n=1 Tax=Salinigranum salinum TaxID=1364937 RepID=UPI001260DC7A|nr:hypothetical protein [Salinigranum salinum]
MWRDVQSAGESQDPYVSLGLVLVGLGALCLAVFYPFHQVFWHVPVTDLLAGGLVVPGETVVIVAGLLLVAAAATPLGILLLFIRL